MKQEKALNEVIYLPEYFVTFTLFAAIRGRKWAAGFIEDGNFTGGRVYSFFEG